MSQVKMIQIERELFKRMIGYVDRHPDPSDPEYRYLVQSIQKKLDAMLRRSLYTTYKTGASEETRALARERYLDEVGVPDSFRWSNRQDTNVMFHKAREEGEENDELLYK